MTRIVLANQGNIAPLYQANSDIARLDSELSKIIVSLNWKLGVDLDIHAFYKEKTKNYNGHVYFGSKGKADKIPKIFLDRDAGVGNVAGDNQEILTISTLAYVDCILIAANIFKFIPSLDKLDNFARYDGVVTITPNIGNEIVVPLTSKVAGKWCVIAKIDNLDSRNPTVVNVNDVTDQEPKIDDYIYSDVMSLTFDNS